MNAVATQPKVQPHTRQQNDAHRTASGGAQDCGEVAATQIAVQTADHELLSALRRGDEMAFVAMVERHYSAMLRVAMMYVQDRASAEEVVQDTWMGLLQGLDRFEGRSSVKTWLFHILANKAKTRAQRDGRTIAFSVLASTEDDSDEPAVEPESFLPADHSAWPRHWAVTPRAWDALPEHRLLSSEIQQRVRQAIEELPEAQRRVIVMRDVEGWSTEEICTLLQITEANQRVLLHRARAKVRKALEAYVSQD